MTENIDKSLQEDIELVERRVSEAIDSATTPGEAYSLIRDALGKLVEEGVIKGKE